MNPGSAFFAVEKCLDTLSTVVGFQIVEMWVRERQGFSLIHTFVDGNNELIQPYAGAVSEYHKGTRKNVLARKICRRLLKSSDGFCWFASDTKPMNPHVPVRTAIGFHVPRENGDGDVFIIIYSLEVVEVGYYENPIYAAFWLLC
jgi:hypothetical protein